MPYHRTQLGMVSIRLIRGELESLLRTASTVDEVRERIFGDKEPMFSTNSETVQKTGRKEFNVLTCQDE